jgi:hypothetical protein
MMGKEITTQHEFNQYEAYNHRETFYLWLHDILEGTITPGFISLANIFRAGISYYDDVYADIAHNHDGDYAAIAHNHDGDYADIAHNHDGDYAAIAHNHDGDYADIAHNHDGDYAALSKALVFSYAAYIGNGAARSINLIGDICHHPKCILGFTTNDSLGSYTGVWLWYPNYTTNMTRIFYNQWSGYTVFSSDPNTSSNFSSVPLAGDKLNVSGAGNSLLVFGPAN